MKRKLPAVAVIVLNYNGLTDTKRCINSLLRTKYKSIHIYIVDNGSLKNEASILEKSYKNKDITFIRFEKNYGFSGGNNRVLKQIKEPYVALINNDIETCPHWLNPIVTLLGKDKTIAAVQSKILWKRNKQYFDYAGGCGGYIDILGYPFTRGRIFTAIEKDRGQYNTKAEIFWASGAAMILRRSILRKIGYFDERFFNYMEEIDLCFRIRKAGYKIVCEPKSYVYHKVASTASRNNIKKRFWEHRNNLLLIAKNFSLFHLLAILPIRFFLEYVSIFYYLSIKRYDYAAGALLSQFAFLFHIPYIISYRMTERKVSPNLSHLIYPGSIVLSFYIFRKKKFSQIFNTRII